MNESQSNRSTAEKLAIFRACFAGLPEVYGTYDPDTGRVWQMKNPVTDKVLWDHITGKQPYGVYLLMKDKINALAVDFDVEDVIPPREFIKSARPYGIAAYLERSKSKGYHVWMFYAEPVSARKARWVVKHILTEIGHATVELFPKQDDLDTRTTYGNFINAPLFENPVYY